MANGVTSIRDVGGDLPTLLAFRARIDSGAVAGPDLLIAGPTLDAPVAVEAFRLLDADPLADIGNIKKIRAVVVRGRFLDRPALDRMLSDAERFASAP